MDQDRENIKLLAVFHWIVAGIAALFAMFPVIHLVVGLGLATGGFHGKGDDGMERWIGALFILFAGTCILIGLAYASCMMIAARSLSQFRNYKFCLVMAGVSCMFAPFGTVLGVFTIILLMKDSVRAMFSTEPAPRSA